MSASGYPCGGTGPFDRYEGKRREARPPEQRSPATMPGCHAGRSPQNNGLRFPADPRTIEEVIAVMHAAVILWRAGLRIQEALALAEPDHDHQRGAVLVKQ